ncbi:HNH endonuclease [Proteus sp. G2663]|uniref:HNH endonuclease n=1 Tax=Proteus sp. G2663 TaxID=2698876 RepID=UPI0013771FAF|nr:HNH endonuclease [Proteus sp. G2663]NBM67884.1 HNH endonuclease [Proteus sp. G2663]
MKYLGTFKKNQPCTWLTVARECRKKNVQELEIIAEDIAEHYKSYDNLIASYNEEIPNSNFLTYSDLLISYYNEAPKNLNQLLLERRNEHELSFCPYCGNPSIPDTLDHFIPKGKWPEFSIFPNNLVPQCRECAPIKGEHYFCDKNNSAMFIHPIYFSFLENFRYSLDIILNEEISDIDICVKLKNIINTQESDKNRVILHAKMLKIKPRIIKYCKRDFRQWKRRLSKKKFDITIALCQRLSELSQSDIGKDWRSAFYHALLQNQEIIDYMNSLCPTESLDQQINETEFELE